MKTPEEIKKGLECHAQACGCEMGCPYLEECRDDEGVPPCREALVYIQQLEADNSRKDDTIRNLTELLNAAHEETAKAMRELEAFRRYEGETGE